jgi:hypothetical protein
LRCSNHGTTDATNHVNSSYLENQVLLYGFNRKWLTIHFDSIIILLNPAHDEDIVLFNLLFQVFCFLINKLHRTLAESGGSVSVNLDEDFQSIFLKTGIEDKKITLGELREKSVEYLEEIFSLFDANNDKFLGGNKSTLYIILASTKLKQR